MKNSGFSGYSPGVQANSSSVWQTFTPVGFFPPLLVCGHAFFVDPPLGPSAVDRS